MSPVSSLPFLYPSRFLLFLSPPGILFLCPFCLPVIYSFHSYFFLVPPDCCPFSFSLSSSVYPFSPLYIPFLFLLCLPFLYSFITSLLDFLSSLPTGASYVFPLFLLLGFSPFSLLLFLLLFLCSLPLVLFFFTPVAAFFLDILGFLQLLPFLFPLLLLLLVCFPPLPFLPAASHSLPHSAPPSQLP